MRLGGPLEEKQRLSARDERGGDKSDLWCDGTNADYDSRRGVWSVN